MTLLFYYSSLHRIQIVSGLLEIVYIRRDQVNLLVYRPDRPYFKQKQKNNIKKFWPTGIFFNLLFSAF